KVISEIIHLARNLYGLRVLHINSTYYGGGVAEMLYSLIPWSIRSSPRSSTRSRQRTKEISQALVAVERNPCRGLQRRRYPASTGSSFKYCLTCAAFPIYCLSNYPF
ncbi:MAG: hypothetical protein Q7I93_02225, partial [Syntrophales bacterium]|nr:hypothetical protein [Syntrophales bacterium]